MDDRKAWAYSLNKLCDAYGNKVRSLEDRIACLEAVVRAGDNLKRRFCIPQCRCRGDCDGECQERYRQVLTAYNAARSRVNLPEIPDRSQSGYFPVQEKAGKQENFLSSQAALDNSNTEASNGTS